MKEFDCYPGIKFTIVQPFVNYMKMSSGLYSSEPPKLEEMYKRTFPDIFMCQTEDNDMYFYFKKINRLYQFICSTMLTGEIIRDVQNETYNLFNICTGNLRFKPENQADCFNRQKIKSMYEFMWHDRPSCSNGELYNPENYELKGLSTVIREDPVPIHTEEGDQSSTDISNN